MRQSTVHILRIDFSDALEDIMKGRIGVIYKALGTWCKPGMHGRASVSFVVVTTETSTELERRMRAPFEQMGCVENYWCFPAPPHALAKSGVDPFVHWLDLAWKIARKRNQSENMGKPKIFGGISKGSI